MPVDDMLTMTSARVDRAELDLRHRDSTRIVGFNLHIEVQWDFSLALVDWCAECGIPLWVYIHDYWPHNYANVASLAARNVRLLASTPFHSPLSPYKSHPLRFGGG